MPVEYERDDALRRVVVTARGPFGANETISVIERQRAEGTWSYGMLYDLRHMTGHPTLADLREIMGKAAARRPGERSRGPVAILTTDPIMYSVACKYAALGRSKLAIQVFRDWDEANLWLTEETSP